MNPNRFIDGFKLKRRRSLVASYRRSQSKIKISKQTSKSARKGLAWKILLCCLGAILVFGLIFNSKIGKIARLAISLKNESILIGFQNSAELRATGGFWGSFAILKVDKNATDSQLYFDTNPYKVDNQLIQQTNVPLPKPMAETWPDRPQSFVNANWSIDFPTAAKDIEWYLGQGWKENVNGVVAISSISIIDLLKLTGPITLPDQTEVNSDNFTRVMSEKIDMQYWDNPQNQQINEPKTILKELAPLLIEKTKKLHLLQLVRFAKEQVQKGRVLVYFNNDREKLVNDIGASGQVLSSSGDYLQISNTNLAANKSSMLINQNVEYHLKSNEYFESELKIKRTYRPDWPHTTNQNYTRVLVPLGSFLTSAKLDGEDIISQVDVSEEYGKTVFGFWFSVDESQSKTVEIDYRLPFSKEALSRYSLDIQKQPGTIADNYFVQYNDEVLFSGILDFGNKKITK